MDAGTSYAAASERLIACIRSLDPSIAVSATPGWDVTDLLRHVVGVAADVVTGNLDEYAQPQWTAAQVRSRAGSTSADLIREWDALVEPMTATLRDPMAAGIDPLFGRAPLIDLLVHEGDAARTAGILGEIDTDAIDELLGARLDVLDVMRDASGLPTLEVQLTDASTRRLGVGSPATTVSTDRVSLWRSLHGRRTRAQVLAFKWAGDATPYVDLWLPWIFSFPASEVERA